MRRNIDGTFVSDDRPWIFIFGLLILIFILASGLWHHFISNGIDGGTIGLALAIGAAVVGAMALPGTRFIFDPKRKQITWRRRSLVASDGGELAFANVHSVVLQNMVDSDGLVFYRVALSTADGTLPLSVQYTSNRAQKERLATAIRGILNVPETQANVPWST